MNKNNILIYKKNNISININGNLFGCLEGCYFEFDNDIILYSTNTIQFSDINVNCLENILREKKLDISHISRLFRDGHRYLTNIKQNNGINIFICDEFDNIYIILNNGVII